MSKDGKIVAMPTKTFDVIVANSIVTRDNNRTRLNTLLEKDKTIRDLEGQVGIKTKGEADARRNEAISLEAAATCNDENVTLQRKNKRLRGWATAMKVQLGMIVIGGGIVAYKSIVP